jgi:hypothetical protein
MESDLHKKHYFINQCKINLLVYADDRVLIADSEENWQIGVFTLQIISNNFGIEISPEKIWDGVIFLGQDPVHPFRPQKELRNFGRD